MWLLLGGCTNVVHACVSVCSVQPELFFWHCRLSFLGAYRRVVHLLACALSLQCSLSWQFTRELLHTTFRFVLLLTSSSDHLFHVPSANYYICEAYNCWRRVQEERQLIPHQHRFQAKFRKLLIDVTLSTYSEVLQSMKLLKNLWLLNTSPLGNCRLLFPTLDIVVRQRTRWNEMVGRTRKMASMYCRCSSEDVLFCMWQSVFKITWPWHIHKFCVGTCNVPSILFEVWENVDPILWPKIEKCTFSLCRKCEWLVSFWVSLRPLTILIKQTPAFIADQQSFLPSFQLCSDLL